MFNNKKAVRGGIPVVFRKSMQDNDEIVMIKIVCSLLWCVGLGPTARLCKDI